MATEILAAGSGAGSSSDVTVVAGTPQTIGLKGVAGVARVAVEIKADSEAYVKIGELSDGNPATVLTGPGVYRFTRLKGTCGVFSA